jgi:hypothetical protein
MRNAYIILYAMCRLLLACAEDSDAFTFRVQVGIPETLTSISSDDDGVVISYDPNSPPIFAIIQRGYADYASADAAPPFTITFTLEDGTTVVTPMHVGSCAEHCSGDFPHCPPVDQLELESLVVDRIELGPAEWSCIECRGAGEVSQGCS